MMKNNYKKTVFSWSMYDFANQPFTTLIVTFIFSAYYTQAIAPNIHDGTFLWSIGIAITALFVAFISPLMGALADQGGIENFYLYFGHGYAFSVLYFCSLLMKDKSMLHYFGL